METPPGGESRSGRPIPHLTSTRTCDDKGDPLTWYSWSVHSRASHRLHKQSRETESITSKGKQKRVHEETPHESGH